MHNESRNEIMNEIRAFERRMGGRWAGVSFHRQIPKNTRKVDQPMPFFISPAGTCDALPYVMAGGVSQCTRCFHFFRYGGMRQRCCQCVFDPKGLLFVWLPRIASARGHRQGSPGDRCADWSSEEVLYFKK